MRNGSYLFTSESVSEGHPDKVCDRISDAVLDAYLTADDQSRVACETLATTNLIVLAGEVRCPSSIRADDIEAVVRSAVKDIGYEQDGFHWQHASIQDHLHAQSQPACSIRSQSSSYWLSLSRNLVLRSATLILIPTTSKPLAPLTH